MVRYRALVEKREGATARAGALRIALLVGDHAAELTLRANQRSGTFLTRFASDAPVTIAMRLEPLQSLKQ
jgi:hypothetical protein